jgi:predicted nicotinamide N-methyase
MTPTASDGADDDIVDVHAFKTPRGVVRVRTRRPKLFPEDTSTAECDETGRVAWRALPALCAYLASDEGYSIVVERSRVLELGAGLGTPGMLCWLSGAARETTLTDGNADVASDLRRSIEMNRKFVDENVLTSLGSATAGTLEWGRGDADDFARKTFPLVVASDVVYSEASARDVLDVVHTKLERDNGMLLLAYVSRWAHVDRALYEAIVAGGWTATLIPVADFDELARKESLEGRPCLFEITRGGCGARGQIRARMPKRAREWFDAELNVLKITPADAFTERFADDLCSTLETHGGAIESLEINAKGPFRIHQDTLRCLLDVFAKHASRVKLIRLKLCETWLDVDGWRALGDFLCESDVRDLEIIGEDVDEEILHAMTNSSGNVANSWVSRLKSLKFSRCDRLNAQAIVALRQSWFPPPALARELECFEVSFCPIGDEGIKSICDIEFVGLRELRLANVGVSAIGGADVASRLVARCEQLRNLDLSGNDCFDANGAAELSTYLETIGKSLVILDLSGCSLGDNGLIWLCEAPRGLKTLRRLETLRLGSNGIGDSAMPALANLFQNGHFPMLKCCDLSMNVISWRGTYDFTEAFDVAAAAAGASPTPLEILSLRGNHIGDDGIDAITDILPNLPHLHTLDVSDCDLTAVAVRRLAESSSSRTFAATLSRNPGIDRTAVAALAREFDDLAFARGLDGF